MSRKIFSLFILVGAILGSAMIHGGCVPTNPYDLVDPYELDPTSAAANNNAFSRASAINLADDSATFSAVLTLADVDVYDLGDFKIGDQLTFDMTIPDRVLLNASVALFDSVGRLFYLTGEWAHIASTELADAEFPAFAPQFDFTVRQATSPLYLAIASQAEEIDGSDEYTGRTGGPYTVSVQVRRWQTGDPVPQPNRQVVALQFDDSTVDYPPMSGFGQIFDNPPQRFSGLSGRVLDPAWWRPFIIMQFVIENYGSPNDPWYNEAAWEAFLDFVGDVVDGLADDVEPADVYDILVNQLIAAALDATTNPATFTPGDPQWFNTRGYTWLYLFWLYLGPGTTGDDAVPGLNIRDNVLPANYPSTMEAAYDDMTAVTAAVKARMQQDYAGLNIDFRVVGTDPIPTDVPVSTVYFVANANVSGLFGRAGTIDIGNVDHADFCVVWGGEIGYFNALNLGDGDSDYLGNSSEGLSYLGVTGSHELGHILGLVHTMPDGADIMSYTGFQAALGHTFTNVPLWSQMFPIGTQDSYLSLLLSLGLAPTP